MSCHNTVNDSGQRCAAGSHVDKRTEKTRYMQRYMREYRQRVRENPARHQVYRERQRKYMKTYHEKRKLMGRNAFFCSDDWIVSCINSAEPIQRFRHEQPQQSVSFSVNFPTLVVGWTTQKKERWKSYWIRAGFSHRKSAYTEQNNNQPHPVLQKMNNKTKPSTFRRRNCLHKWERNGPGAVKIIKSANSVPSGWLSAQ